MDPNKVAVRPLSHKVMVSLTPEQALYVKECLTPGQVHHDVWINLRKEPGGEYFFELTFIEPITDINTWFKELHAREKAREQE